MCNIQDTYVWGMHQSVSKHQQLKTRVSFWFPEVLSVEDHDCQFASFFTGSTLTSDFAFALPLGRFAVPEASFSAFRFAAARPEW